MKQLLATFLLAAATTLPTWADNHQPTEAEKVESTTSQKAASDTDASAEGSGIRIRTSDDEESIHISIIGGGFDKLLEQAQQELDNKNLSDAERAEIEQEIELAKKVLGDLDINAAIDSDQARLGILTGIIAVILFFTTPLIIVGLVLYASHRRRRLAHETINNYVQSGRDIPPELIESMQKTAKVTTPKTSLHKGLVTGGVGLGVLAAFSMMGNQTVAALGLIPLFIGIAQILVWKLDKRNDNGFGG